MRILKPTNAFYATLSFIKRQHEWMKEWMNEWMDGWTDGRTDGWDKTINNKSNVVNIYVGKQGSKFKPCYSKIKGCSFRLNYKFRYVRLSLIRWTFKSKKFKVLFYHVLFVNCKFCGFNYWPRIESDLKCSKRFSKSFSIRMIADQFPRKRLWFE